MEEYMKYVDKGALQLGDLAFEIGDYTCALDHLFKAYNKLKDFQGNEFEMLSKMGNLSYKIKEAIARQSTGKSILINETWKLSKSSFVRGNQCVKSLFLDKFKRMERNPISPEKQALFSRGHNFEDLVRQEKFPGGINVKEKVGNFFYFNSYTKHLIESTSETVIYEASIIEDDVLVMCDILVKNGEKIDIYEVKMNAEINDAIRSDLAIQYAICKKRFGENLNSFNLILRSKEENSLCTIIDVTADVSPRIEQVQQRIDDFKLVFENQEPTLAVGNHCMTPYECDFTNYCGARNN